MDKIKIRGLIQNNLKNIDLDIPKHKIVIFTGVSGPGKSSIVFDTIATESGRQLNETFAAFIRGKMCIRDRLKVASKISNQRHMTAIKNAFTALLPIIITGAFCTLFSNVVCSTTTTGISLAKIDGFAWLEELTPLFTAANYATLNFFTIGTVV